MSHEASLTEINFLDLKTAVRDDKFVTSTYFKATDRNSYIPINSCHYSSWLSSVPKSQYMRPKRNCTETSDFLIQANTLTNRFLNKGYSNESLQTTLNQVSLMHRKDLLKEKSLVERINKAPSVPFITTFSVQHQTIKYLIYKHWHILGNDSILNTVLPTKPQVIYKGASLLRNRLATNVYDALFKRSSFFQTLTGFY